jgi:nickel-dependent lactate racemase
MNITAPALQRDADFLRTLETPPAGPALGEREIRDGLLHPLWPDRRTDTVFDIVRPGESLCLVVSDYTRKTAADRVLPVLLRGLVERGCRLRDAFFLVASGIHRPCTTAEVGTILGSDVAAEFRGRVFLHDPDDQAGLVEVGVTRRGHRVRVNRRAIEADRLVPIGAAVFHYHAGFGGGRKSLVPGLASRDTIAQNHGLTLDPSEDRLRPGVEIGRLDGNPVSEEMFEGAQFCRPDLIVNTALTPSGRLAGVFSGDLDAAHRAACDLARTLCGFPIERTADLAIASASPATNWIQSHKALFNASRAVHDGGRIVLLAPCPEGLGNERFRHWVRMGDPARIYRELRNSDEVLGQTALSTRTRGQRTILVTDMPAADAADLGIATAPDLDAAVERALSELRAAGIRRPSYYLMPQAGLTVPFPRA